MLISDPDSRDYWVYDLRDGRRNRITFGGLSVSTVTWTPDSRYIFFGAGAGNSVGSIGIYVTTADGSGQPQRILQEKGGVNFVTSYSAAAKRLLYWNLGFRIFTLPLAEQNNQWKATGTPEPFHQTEFQERMPAFLPDGRWIAYTTRESRQLEVVVRPFPTSGQSKRTISTSGGTRPNWSGDGRELLYQEGDRIMSVSYTANGNSFEAAPPRVRVEKLGANEDDWDLATDGRIAATVALATQEAATPPPAEHHVVFVENFFDEVRRKVR